MAIAAPRPSPLRRLLWRISYLIGRVMAPVGAKREGAVETLRGLALLALVAYHASVEPPPAFITAHREHHVAYDYLGHSLIYVRMPLFTVISGFVYALRPVQAGRLLSFLKGKARRLLLPLISAVTLTLLFAHVMGSKTGLALPLSRLHEAYLYPFTHFWFLQAICWVFISIAVLEGFGWLSALGPWLGVLAVSCIARALIDEPPRWFAFDGFLYLAPFFLLGLGLRRFESSLRRPAAARAAAGIALFGLLLQQLALQGFLSLNPLDKLSLLSTVTGLSSSMALLFYRVQLPLLASLGSYSYTVYLYHHFGIAAGKQLAAALDVGSYHALFLLKCGAGLAVGILVERSLSHFSALSTVVLGTSARRATPSTAPIQDPRQGDSSGEYRAYLKDEQRRQTL